MHGSRDGKTFKVEATVADKGVDADEVTIDIEGAKDAAGNLQVDHTAVWVWKSTP